MKKFILLILAICALGLTGCATIFSGSRQSIVFSAPQGTRIYSEGLMVAEIPNGYDAVSVRMDRSLSGKNMMARKEGYRDTYFYLRPRVNGVVFLNLLWGPWLIVGGGVDLLTGAAAEYPNYVQIWLDPEEDGSPSSSTDVDSLLQY